MFDTPVDGWYTWLGVALAGVTVLGVTLGLPVAPPPTATDIATAVDATATSERDAATTVDVDAEAIRLTPRGVAVRGRGGAARAAFQYGPVVPVDGERLRAVLDGAEPARVFASPAALKTAAIEARTTEPEWRPAPRRLRVRHVTWGGVDVTLVG